MLDNIRVPLAWLNLVHDKRRFALSVAGICFAVVLTCVELGFRNALFDSSVEVIRQLDADLIVTSTARVSLIATQQFPRRRLAQALEVEGVAAAYPLYVEYYLSEWKNPAQGRAALHDAAPASASLVNPIRVLAFDPDHPVLRLPAVRAQQERLREPDTVLVDELSRKQYGLLSREAWEKLPPTPSPELAGRSVRVVGRFRLGTDFSTNGNVVMSDVSFARYFPGRGSSRSDSPQPGSSPPSARPTPLAEVDLALLKLAPGADLDRVRAALRASLPDDVTFFTVDKFVRQEMAFWATVTPIGFVFGLGMVMGFLIGAVICYQVLSTEVEDHLAEYATLKAIGYHDRYLNRVILQEAGLLAVLGFIPGVALSWLLYGVLAAWTGLPMRLTPVRAGCVLGLTVLMCMLSGLTALRKVKEVDPTEVF